MCGALVCLVSSFRYTIARIRGLLCLNTVYQVCEEYAIRLPLTPADLSLIMEMVKEATMYIHVYV